MGTVKLFGYDIVLKMPIEFRPIVKIEANPQIGAVVWYGNKQMFEATPHEIWGDNADGIKNIGCKEWMDSAYYIAKGINGIKRLRYILKGDTNA